MLHPTSVDKKRNCEQLTEQPYNMTISDWLPNEFPSLEYIKKVCEFNLID